MARIYPTLEASAIHQRAEALARFSAWEQGHRTRLSPTDALSGVALLFELLPKASRARPVEPAGVRELHRCLAVLSRRPD